MIDVETFSSPNRYPVISTFRLRPFLLYCCTRLEANKTFARFSIWKKKKKKKKIHRWFLVSVELEFAIDLNTFNFQTEREK